MRLLTAAAIVGAYLLGWHDGERWGRALGRLDALRDWRWWRP